MDGDEGDKRRGKIIIMDVPAGLLTRFAQAGGVGGVDAWSEGLRSGAGLRGWEAREAGDHDRLAPPGA